MARINSFEQAVYQRQIVGPPGFVADLNTGEPSDLSNQNYGHTHLGREVIGISGGKRGYVEDWQDPSVVEWAETKPMHVSSPLLDVLDFEYRIFGGSRMHRFGED